MKLIFFRRNMRSLYGVEHLNQTAPRSGLLSGTKPTCYMEGDIGQRVTKNGD